MGRVASAAAVVALVCLASGVARPVPAAEAPPAQGTRLHFQKTLFIHNSALGRVFAESRRSEKESSLAGILAADYGVSEDALAPLQQAFRELNPGVDAARIPAGKTIRVPFKIEEALAGAPAAPAPAPPPDSYTVHAGDSLWKILKGRYRIPRDAMSKMVAAVARANPGVRDLNHLVAGQTLAMPVRGLDSGQPTDSPKTATGTAPSRSMLTLLDELGCQVLSKGEVFLPVARGRTIRLDTREFPIASGPSGRKVVFDPSARLSAALARSLEEAWSYTVIQGADSNEEALLERLLPKLGFHEVTEGPKRISLARGVDLVAEARWTVIPREEDLWEGRIHLLVAQESALNPDLLGLAVRSGHSVHILGGGSASVPERAASPSPFPRVPEIRMSDPAQGEAALLKALGVPHRIRPDVECDLGSGVRYRLQPEITFEHEGTAYAVPPPEPRRAEALLTKAGYFTIPLAAASAPLDRLADLLALLKKTPRRVVEEIPRGQTLRLRVEGISMEAPGLPAQLYPGATVRGGTRVLLTSSDVTPEVASFLLKQGYAPWVVRAPEPTSPVRP